MRPKKTFFLYLICAAVSTYLFMDSFKSGQIWRVILLGFQLFFFLILTFQSVQKDKV